MAVIDTIANSEETNMAKIDTDKLRDYLEDYCGAAASSGFPAALLDVRDIENMDGYELCEKAEDLGIDLERFRVD
ncbi:hypothetical protein [Adlercreutzia equolifaciens]|uniref:hypothetical protein n=1 Tax=Adlercreutzia equolifaciens TaxID=446660 RepID=UPI003A8578F4